MAAVEFGLSDVLSTIGTVASIVTGNPAPAAIGAALGGMIDGSSPSVQGITAAQAGAISGGFAGPVTSTGTSVGPGVAVSPGFTEAGFGGAAARVIPPLVTALPQILGRPSPPVTPFLAAPGRAAIGPPPPAGGPLPTKRQAILQQARFFAPGATAKKIVRSARECGIELAAQTFGLNVLQVCFLIAQPPTRRRRGISAADLRRTRSTIRKVTTIQKDLKQLFGPIRRK